MNLRMGHCGAVVVMVCAVLGCVTAAAVDSSLTTPATAPATSDASNSLPHMTLIAITAQPPAPPPLVPSSNSSDAGEVETVSLHVTAGVTLRYARVSAVTRVRNDNHLPQQTTFSLVLPDSAFISGFVMTLGGKDYKAYVREKEEARHEYETAASQGQAAAHVATEARDASVVRVRASVPARSEAVFNLTYEELLERRGARYRLALELRPGRALADLRVAVELREPRPITAIHVPAPRTPDRLTHLDEPEYADAVVTRSSDARKASVVFAPDIAEQERLMRVYNETCKTWECAGGGGALGQFVVEYDVEHTHDGEIYVSDGYFVHWLSPPQLAPLSKHVVFVLDTSGSMLHRKLQQLQDAMRAILADLRAHDYFSIVDFSNTARVYGSDESNVSSSWWQRAEQDVPLAPPSPATPHNVQLAQQYVSSLNAAGGTNIAEALVTALRIVARGVTSNETETSTPDPALLNSVNGEAAWAPEAMVLFLTDGDPTVGETDTERILRVVSKNNENSSVAIFSLAFGEDADRGFLRKLSLRNQGFMRHIYEAADAPAQLKDFYAQISSPLLSGVKFIYPPEQVEEESLTRRTAHALYAGGETVVVGKLAPDQEHLEATVLADGAADGGGGKKKYKTKVRVGVVRGEGEWGPLERLWAFLSIRQKLEEQEVWNETAGTESPKQQALRLALKYQFVTPLTSLVVVQHNSTESVDPHPIDKTTPDSPYALPHQAGPSLLSAAFAAPAASYSTSAMQQYSVVSPEHYQSAVYEYEEEDTPDGASSSTSSSSANSTHTPACDRELSEYGLCDMEWARPLLVPGGLRLSVANATHTLRLLAQPHEHPESVARGAACTAAHGRNGTCVYITNCASKPVSLQQYTELYCHLHRFAGVCCAQDDIASPPAAPSPGAA